MRQKSASIADLGRTGRISRGTLFAVQQQGSTEQLSTTFYGAVGAVLDESPRIRSATIVTSLDADVANVVSLGANQRFNLVSCQTVAADLGTITAIVGDNATFTSVVQSPEFDVLDEGAVYFYEADANGAHRVGLKAAASLAASYTLTLPTTDGTSGQVMRTDGAGILSWMTPGDVVGPASATDNAFALFDGTTGKLLKNSAVDATFTGTGSVVRATSPTLTTPTMSSPTISDRILKVAGGDITLPNTAGTVCLVAGFQALTNKTLFDNSVTFVDNADTSKVLAFQCSGISTATTRTLTIPDASGTIALTSDLAAYQPLDSDLTAIAALSTTAFGRGLLTETDASTTRTTLGLVIGTNVQAYDADLASWAGVTRASGFDTFAATPSSANLAALLSDETGTGAAVFATNPTLVTPALGTPTSGNLSSCTNVRHWVTSYSSAVTVNTTRKHFPVSGTLASGSLFTTNVRTNMPACTLREMRFWCQTGPTGPDTYTVRWNNVTAGTTSSFTVTAGGNTTASSLSVSVSAGDQVVWDVVASAGSVLDNVSCMFLLEY